MPLYFFHLRDGTDIVLDPEGRDLDDRDAISAAALKEARSIIAHEAQSGRIKLNQRIDVEDELRAVLHSLHFVDAVEIVRP